MKETFLEKERVVILRIEESSLVVGSIACVCTWTQVIGSRPIIVCAHKNGTSKMSGSDRRDSYTSRRDSPAPTRDDTSDRNVPNGPRLNSTSYSRPSSSYDSRDRTSSSYSRHDARDAYASSRRDSSNYARSSRDDYYDRPSSSYEDRKHYDSRDREDRPSSRAMERNPSEGSSSREPPAVAAALPDRPTSKPLSKKALIPSIPFRKPSSVGSYTAPAPTSARPADPIPPSSRPSDPPPPPPQEPLHVPSPPKAPEPIEKLKPAFRVTYDPLLDTSPVKKSKTIIMRVGGEGLPGGPLPDPRKEASFDRSNGRKSLTHLTELEYAVCHLSIPIWCDMLRRGDSLTRIQLVHRLYRLLLG